MTEKQKRRLLHNIKRKELKRSEIEKFCTGNIELDYIREIDSLCSENMICMTQYTNFENGVFKPSPNDLFEIGDRGKDFLENIRKDRIRTYIPISISFLSLVVAVISLIVSFIVLIAH